MTRILTFILLLISSISWGQFDIKFTLNDYANDTLLVGHYLGNRTLVNDTLYRQKDNIFRWSGNDTIPSGVYLIVKRPNNNFVQFIMDGKDHFFDITWNSSDDLDVTIVGSDENKLFFDYLNFISDKKILAQQLREKQSKTNIIADSVVIVNKFEQLDNQVKKKQFEIVDIHPNSVTTSIIKSGIPIDIPVFAGSESEVKLQEFEYYKKHYFDHIDLRQERNIRTPFLHQKIEDYIEKLTAKDADSIICSIDYLLNEMKSGSDCQQFYISYFLNKYANMKIVGMDAVYVHMIDKYYNSGQAPWVDTKTLKKLRRNSNNLRPTLIGKIFPDIITYTLDSAAVRLHDIESKFTVVLFWAHDCPHCKKVLPSVVEFFDKFKDKGVQIITICTKQGEKAKECKKASLEKNMDQFINTFDRHQVFRQKVWINSTPKIFVLDHNKKILVKDFAVEKLSSVMDRIIEFSNS